MKKVIYLLGIMLLMAGAAKAQDNKAVPMGPEIEFEKVVHDYGDVPYNGNDPSRAAAVPSLPGPRSLSSLVSQMSSR